MSSQANRIRSIWEDSDGEVISSHVYSGQQHLDVQLKKDDFPCDPVDGAVVEMLPKPGDAFCESIHGKWLVERVTPGHDELGLKTLSPSLSRLVKPWMNHGRNLRS